MGSWLSATSDPKVVTTAAGPVFEALLFVAPFVALCALCANVLTGLRRLDGPGLARDAALMTPLIVVGVFLARPFATLILHVVDALCSGASAGATKALSQLTLQATTLPSAIPAFGALLLAIAEVIGAVLIWFELIIRNAVLSLLLCLAPVVFASALWAPLRRLAVRLIETFVAVALTKFVVVVALALGVTAAQSSSATVVLTGIAVVFLAILSPFTLMRVVPLLELSAVHSLEGIRQRATSGVRRAAGVASSGVARMKPDVTPGPPLPREDLGLEDWEPGPEIEFPPLGGTPPPPPVGEPQLRTGKVAYFRDRFGPVMGWHFDE